MAARSIDKVTISFGLVSIPARVYTTSEPSHEVSFHLLHAKDGARLKQQFVCPKDGEVVERDEMVKGFEYSKGKYVTLTKAELKALEAVSSNTIALQEFVPAAAVDPIYFDRSYYLGPDKGGERAYALLTRAMTEAELVGVATYAARGKQYVVVIRPQERGLVMHQLRYPDEIKPWDEIPLPAAPRVKEPELALARQVIRQIATDSFEPEKYHDDVKVRVREAIERKLEGEEIVVEAEAPAAKVVDLMEALRASLQGQDKGKPAARTRRGGRARPARPARTARTTRPRAARSHRGAGARSRPADR
jgi:DNA end-binding protein Ku